MRAISGRETGRSRRRSRASRAPPARGPAATGRSKRPRARLGRLASRAEGPAARDLLEDDPAATLAVASGEQPERGLDPLRLVLCGRRELLDRERRDATTSSASIVRASAVDGVVDERRLARAYEIGSKGAAAERRPRPALRSSRSARNATACSTRREPVDLAVEEEAAAAARTARKRSRKQRERREGRRYGGATARAARRRGADRGRELRGLLRRERPLRHRRERRRADAEPAVALGRRAAPRASRRSCGTPIGGEALGELARRLLGVEILEGRSPRGRARAPSARGARRRGRGTRRSRRGPARPARRPLAGRPGRSRRSPRRRARAPPAGRASEAGRTAPGRRRDRAGARGRAPARELYVGGRTRPLGMAIVFGAGFGGAGSSPLGRRRALAAGAATRRSATIASAKTPRRPRVQAQAEILVRRVDAQRLLEEARRSRVPGDVERKEAGRLDLEAAVDEEEEADAEQVPERLVEEERVEGCSVTYCAGRFSGRSRAPREGRSACRRAPG